MLSVTIIFPSLKEHTEVPIEAQMHLANIYVEEIAKASDEFLTEDKVMLFLEPYLKVS